MSAVDWKCNHAPSGCNYPEGECAGLCMPAKVPDYIRSIKIPTDTMEQEFQNHYRRGFEAGKKAAQPVQPAVAQGEPLFWYRPVGSDGGYEGPIHNGAIEEVRKRSGAWFGLYPQAPAAAINEQLLEALEKLALACGRNDGWEDYPREMKAANAAIAAAEAEKAKGGV